MHAIQGNLQKIQTFNNPNVQKFRRRSPNFRSSKHSKIQNFKSPDFQISKLLTIQISKNENFKSPNYKDSKISQIQAFKNPDFEKSKSSKM